MHWAICNTWSSLPYYSSNNDCHCSKCEKNCGSPNHHFSFLYIFLTIYYNWYILSRMVHITIYCKDVLVSSNFNKMYWTAANWAKKCTGQQYIQGERKRGWYLGRGGCAWLCRRAWVASTYAPALFHLYPADRERMRWIRSVAHAFYKL